MSGAIEANTETRDWRTISVGDGLPALVLNITATRVVAGAIASRDFHPVHHDRDFAASQGAENIFLNIMSDNGYTSRYLTDWAGPDAMLRRVALRLGVPAYAGSTLTFNGKVTAVEPNGDVVRVDVEVSGFNDLGEHVGGTATLAFPAGAV